MTPGVSNAALQAEVLAAEEERCRRISESDWAALEDILADEFVCTHSSGKSEAKSAWIEGISVRPKIYVRDNLKASIYGNGEVAVVSGDLTNTTTTPDGSPNVVVLDVLQVWVKRDGHWQLVANHGIKPADKN